MSQRLGADRSVAALANQADRANRPTTLVVIAGVILLAALIYLVIGLQTSIGARESLRAASNTQYNTARQLSEIEKAKTTGPDLEIYSGSAALMPTALNKIASEVWGETSGGRTFIRIDASPDKKPLNENPSLLRSTVNCTISNQPIEQILEFLKATDTDERMAKAFVSRLRLTPTPQGWNAEIEFRRYELNDT